MSFKPHIQQPVNKAEVKIVVFFSETSQRFFFEAKRSLTAGTLMSVLDYGHVSYMHVFSQCLHRLDIVYHGALRFITNLKSLTRHCSLSAQVGWSALSTCSPNYWYILICKAMCSPSPSPLGIYILQKSMGSYCLYSQDLFLLNVPTVHTDLRIRVKMYAASSAWNKLQSYFLRSWSRWMLDICLWCFLVYHNFYELFFSFNSKSFVFVFCLKCVIYAAACLGHGTLEEDIFNLSESFLLVK